MNNIFKNTVVEKNGKTIEDKIAILKEINNETCGWGINKLLEGICDYYCTWHMTHMDETYTRLANAYSYEELVDYLNEWKEN